MAAEVLHHKYQFTEDPFDLEDWFSLYLEGEEDPPIPFEHNIAHDIESLFWLAIFILFFNKDVNAPPETEDIANSRKNGSECVFPGNMSDTKGNRTSLISNPKELGRNATWLSESFKRPLGALLKFFPLFRQVYRDIHRASVESKLPQKDIKVFGLLIQAMIITFGACRRGSENVKIQSRKSKGLVQGNSNAPKQPKSNPNGQHPPNPTPNDQQPDSKPDNQQPPAHTLDSNARKREHEEEEYKIADSPRYPRRK